MLPKHRPPASPGEMLLEEFLKPRGVTPVELASRADGRSDPALPLLPRNPAKLVPSSGACRSSAMTGIPFVSA